MLLIKADFWLSVALVVYSTTLTSRKKSVHCYYSTDSIGIPTTVDRQWLNSAGTGRNGVPPPVSGVPPPEIAVPQPKVVVPPPGNDFFAIWGKIIKIFATIGQILRLKCTKYYFGWGSAPDPTGGDYSARPESLAGRGRPTSKGDGRQWKRRRADWGRKGKGRNVAFHHLLLSNLTTVDRITISGLEYIHCE